MGLINQDGIAFVDFEASSLGSNSFPTEIGWAKPDRFPDFVQSGSSLIRPIAKWLRSETAWSPASERLTGITKKSLETEGVRPAEAMAQLLAAVGDRTLFSDQPDFDNHWLSILADAAGVELGDKRLGDAKKLFADVAAKHPRPTGALVEAELTGLLAVPARHRAEPDARRLALVYSWLVDHAP